MPRIRTVNELFWFCTELVILNGHTAELEWLEH